MAPIVGRDQELALLIERWRQAKSGEGQVVLLTGEAGIGKSRITEALIETAAGEPHFLLRYQCSPYHADRAASDPAARSCRRLRRGRQRGSPAGRLETLLTRATDDIREAAPWVAALMGLDATVRYGALMLTPQQRRSRTLAVLIDQLTGLASRARVVGDRGRALDRSHDPGADRAGAGWDARHACSS